MNRFGIIASAAVVSLFLAGCGNTRAEDKSSTKAKNEAPASTQKKEEVSQNAALVNGKPITMANYELGIDQLNRQMAMSGQKPDDKEMPALKQKVLDNLIGRELLRQEAAKRGLTVDDAEVNAQLEAYKQHSPTGDFSEVLKHMNMTEAALKDHIASQLAVKKLVDEDLASKIVVTPEEAKKFYDENQNMFKTPEMVRASHILVGVDKGATAEQKAQALEKIKGIQKRLQNGEDFAAVAKEVSDCPSKNQGGDLNFFSKGQMVPPFEKAAFSMKVGDTSDIVETEFGYHIIKLTDKKPEGTVSFDEAKPRIEQHLKAQKVAEEMSKYIDSLKAKAKIEILVKS